MVTFSFLLKILKAFGTSNRIHCLGLTLEESELKNLVSVSKFVASAPPPD